MTMNTMTPSSSLRGLIATAIFACSWSVQAGDEPAAKEKEPIVGLWLITVTNHAGIVVDNVFSGWTSDGLEFDQDTGSPMLTGYVCYGTWIKLGDHTYGLTHPFFDYNPGTITAPLPFDGVALGIWDGTSGYFNYVVTVSEDGKTFTGTQNGTVGVPGPDPYVGAMARPPGPTLSARKIEVNRSLLP
jgi:hypothetical protein